MSATCVVVAVILGLANVQRAATIAQAQTGIVAGAKQSKEGSEGVKDSSSKEQSESTFSSPPPFLPPLTPTPSPVEPEYPLHKFPTSSASCQDGTKTCSWRQVVPGHIGLPGLLESEDNTSKSFTSPSGFSWAHNCTLVFEVARDIVQDFMNQLQAADANDADIQEGTGIVWKLLNEQILVMHRSNETFEGLMQILNRDSLSDAIQLGHSWTQTDNAMWAACNTGAGNEEDDSDGTCQGDEYCSHGSVLLQFQSSDPVNMSMRSFLALAAHRNWKWAPNTWPKNNGAHEIPYCWDNGVSQDTKDALRAAMDHIEEQVPCIKFKMIMGSVEPGSNPYNLPTPVNCPEFPSVLMTSQKTGCASAVGMVSGVAPNERISQIINMGANCDSLGIAAHELLHTLGFLHEMSRTDRDEYVAVQEENIKTGVLNNFETKDFAIWDGEIFDFNSLMMYGAWAFTNNGEQTIVPKGDIRLTPWLGQRMGLSQMDVEKVGTLYNCKDEINPLTLDKQLSQDYVNGEGLDGHFKGSVCKDVEQTGFRDAKEQPMSCTDLQTHCNHETLGKKVRELCPVSCFTCVPGLGNSPAPLPPGQNADSSDSSYSQEHRRRRSVKNHAYSPARPGLWIYVLTVLLIRTWI